MRRWVAHIDTLLLPISMGFAASAAVLIARRVHVLVSGGTAVGTVVEHERREIDDGLGFHPVVAFVDHAGQAHTFTSGVGWGRPAPPVGSSVRVRYLHGHPSVAYIQSFAHLWIRPLALLFCAEAFLPGAR